MTLEERIQIYERAFSSMVEMPFLGALILRT